MFKFSKRIPSLLQQSHMPAFGLHFTSTLKGLTLSTKMHHKISKRILFYCSWQNQHIHRSTVLHLQTVTCIFLIS